MSTPITGQELYALYRIALREESNCYSDTWEELDDTNRAEWNTLARLVNERQQA